MSNFRYRPDIDGLRAFAVLGVILFHLSPDLLPGGFVGVDVFFVISSFLITGIIRNEFINTGSFSFVNFYVRRVRRLFPALFVTLYASFIFAALLFSASHFEKFGGSLASALASVSNFFFWVEADYFDAAANVKPLLHTWSLSVEEQFYLLWPMLLILMLKTRRSWLVPLGLSCILGLSLYLNEVFGDGEAAVLRSFSAKFSDLFTDGKSTLFYLIPFRAYEFAIGGLMVFIVSARVKSRVFHESCFLLGLILIAYAMFTFTEKMLFPGYSGLVPCLGTALIIYSGEHAQSIRRLLTNKIAVGIGLISYSLYLVHWPIIVFWQYFTFEKITKYEGACIVAVSMLLASLIYKYIEQPFRVKKGRKPLGGKSFALVILLAWVALFVVSLHVSKSGGWKWRVREVIDESFVSPAVELSRLKGLDRETKWTRAYRVGSDSAEVKVLVLGDSHARQLKSMAAYLSERYDVSFSFYTFIGCPPVFGAYRVYDLPEGITNEGLRQKNCRIQIEKWEDYVRSGEFDYVLLSARWNWLFEPAEYYDTIQPKSLLVDKNKPQFSEESSRAVFASQLDYTVSVIHDSGAKAILFGQVPHSGKDLEGCNNMPSFLLSDKKINQRCNHVPRTAVLARSAFSNQTIKDVALAHDAIAVLPTEFFCDGEVEFCQYIEKGTRLKDDDDHVNPYGAVYIAQEWGKTSDFPFKETKRD